MNGDPISMHVLRTLLRRSPFKRLLLDYVCLRHRCSVKGVYLKIRYLIIATVIDFYFTITNKPIFVMENAFNLLLSFILKLKTNQDKSLFYFYLVK